ncbi:hypothetical protein ACFLQ2_04805 [archaeon]
MNKQDVRKKFGQADKMILALVVSAGVVFYWRGIWELSESIFPPMGSLIVGVTILVSTGYLTKELL